MTGILGNYAKRKSSMSWEEKPIRGHPTLTVCFDDQVGNVWSRNMFDLGSEMNITYEVLDGEG